MLHYVAMTAKLHYIYILRCADDSLYCGYATDVIRREQEHNGEGKVAGAKYTQGRRPVRVVYTESFQNRSEAQKREAQIKSLPRKKKLELIASALDTAS